MKVILILTISLLMTISSFSQTEIQSSLSNERIIEEGTEFRFEVRLTNGDKSMIPLDRYTNTLESRKRLLKALLIDKRVEAIKIFIWHREKGYIEIDHIQSNFKKNKS